MKKCRTPLQELIKDEKFRFLVLLVWSEREYSVSPLLEERRQLVRSPCCDAGPCEPYKHSKDKMFVCVCALPCVHACTFVCDDKHTI